VPARGGAAVQVTRGGGFRGDWSPDGGRIAYDKELLQGSMRETGSQPSVEIAEATTGKVLRKLSVSDLGSPVWSPDGKRLSATQRNSVWTIDPETGEGRRAIQMPAKFCDTVSRGLDAGREIRDSEPAAEGAPHRTSGELLGAVSLAVSAVESQLCSIQ
jgi:Tol biopolymer transport system component